MAPEAMMSQLDTHAHFSKSSSILQIGFREVHAVLLSMSKEQTS